jgi:ATP/maltotriose-dependent transcriptional regulator MalT
VPREEVLALAKALRETADRAGASRAVAFATALVGEVLLLDGDLDRAEAELERALAMHREIGATAGESVCLHDLARVRLARGDRAGSVALLQRSLPLARWSPVAMHTVERVYGTMIEAATNASEARATVDAAVASLAPEDYCPFCSILFQVPAAVACARAGDVDAARAHEALARQSADLWQAPAWEAALLEVQAHIAAAEGRADDAERLLAEAGAGFEAARLPLDAARCRAAEGLRKPAA